MNIIESGITFASLAKRSITSYIVLHHADASVCSIHDVNAWHKQNGWAGVGYNFFVRKDGSVYRGRPIDAVGAHIQGFNGVSVGICAEGAYMSETMPLVQKNAIVDLVKYLLTLYPTAKVVGHKDLASSQCPGVNYPLAEIKAEIATPKHWAQDAFNLLKERGIIIKETRFDDKITRGEVFVLLSQIVAKIKED